ncbi:MAG: anti-sigma factor family protein [Rhodanobacteraceae bacterium]
MNTTIPDEYEIQAFVDGRLDEPRRQAVEFYLAQHPEQAEEVRAWQRDAQELRAAFGALPTWPKNPALDPARIRLRHRQRTLKRLAMAAMLVLCLGLGGLGGWRLQGWRQARIEPPMGDALQAYRMFASAQPAHFDFVPRGKGSTQVWLDRHFERAPRLPDLVAAGFQPVGGRLFATADGPAAMVVYANGRGGAISFYLRPPSARGPLPRGQRRDGGLMAEYGSHDGYNYAMVGRADAQDMQVIRGALRSHIGSRQ